MPHNRSPRRTCQKRLQTNGTKPRAVETPARGPHTRDKGPLGWLLLRVGGRNARARASYSRLLQHRRRALMRGSVETPARGPHTRDQSIVGPLVAKARVRRNARARALILATSLSVLAIERPPRVRNARARGPHTRGHADSSQDHHDGGRQVETPARGPSYSRQALLLRLAVRCGVPSSRRWRGLFKRGVGERSPPGTFPPRRLDRLAQLAASAVARDG